MPDYDDAETTMIGIWFPEFFKSDTGAKFLASSDAILISALIAGFILWVVW